MKYDEMDETQQDAFKGIFLTVLSVKSQEERQYTQQFFRLLLLGNRSGILILTTLMGALVGNKDRVYLLRAPLIAFFVGRLWRAGLLSFGGSCGASYELYFPASDGIFSQ